MDTRLSSNGIQVSAGSNWSRLGILKLHISLHKVIQIVEKHALRLAAHQSQVGGLESNNVTTWRAAIKEGKLQCLLHRSKVRDVKRLLRTGNLRACTPIVTCHDPYLSSTCYVYLQHVRKNHATFIAYQSQPRTPPRFHVTYNNTAPYSVLTRHQLGSTTTTPQKTDITLRRIHTFRTPMPQAIEATHTAGS